MLKRTDHHTVAGTRTALKSIVQLLPTRRIGQTCVVRTRDLLKDLSHRAVVTHIHGEHQSRVFTRGLHGAGFQLRHQVSDVVTEIWDIMTFKAQFTVGFPNDVYGSLFPVVVGQCLPKVCDGPLEARTYQLWLDTLLKSSVEIVVTIGDDTDLLKQFRSIHGFIRRSVAQIQRQVLHSQHGATACSDADVVVADLQLLQQCPYRVHTGLGTALQLGFSEEQRDTLGKNDVFIHVENSVLI